MLDTRWVSSGDEVSNASVNTGGSVPQNLSWASVVHWGWPKSEDGVVIVEGSVLEESGVLSHSVVGWDIIVLAPSTEWVKEKDWVLVSLLDKLLSGILEEENVTIVEWVTDLEGVDGIGTLGLGSLLDLLGGKSPLVEVVVEGNSLDEVHGLSRDEEISLLHVNLSLGVLGGEGSESTGADLLLSVIEEAWLVDDSEDIVAELSALEGNLLLSSKGLLLLSGDWLSDWDGKEVSLANLVGEGLHLEALEELELVHEAVEWESPAITDGLEVLSLLPVDVEDLEASVLGGLGLSWGLDEGVDDASDGVVLEDLLLNHVVDDEGLAGIEGKLTSVDIELWVGWSLIRVRDTGEVLDDTVTSLFVETLDISSLANFEGGGDVALEEVEAGLGVNLSSEVSVLGVWGDEGDEADLTGEGEELGDLSDTADVLGSVLSREAEVLVESLSDDIAIEDEALSVVTNEDIDLLLEGLGEGGLTGTGQTSEPVGSSVDAGVGGGRWGGGNHCLLVLEC